ncbi:preprotein translocase subunit TatA [uncultured Amnibacterium sp.]|uniref:preprotein translocase subunit TatA n=1 Tax=uncultured Amnibacterium sp. TaxID=1631851 RepID=UPI0035CC5E05
MFDLPLGTLLVIGVLALFLVGPDKLPRYAAQLATWVRVARSMTDDAKKRVASEMGPEFEEVDWAGLDPRRYHPRRLLTDAWNSAGERAPVPPPAAIEQTREHEPDLLALAEARAMEEAVAVRR